MSTLGPCPAWQQLVGVGSSRKEPLNMIDAKGKGPYAQMASPMMTLPSPALSSGFCVCVCVCVVVGGGGLPCYVWALE